MASTINLECKNCGATLTLDADRKTAFCTYCGAKIDLTEPVQRTETIIHNIDEARLKEVDANERSRAKELELEERRLENQRRAEQDRLDFERWKVKYEKRKERNLGGKILRGIWKLIKVAIGLGLIVFLLMFLYAKGYLS